MIISKTFREKAVTRLFTITSNIKNKKKNEGICFNASGTMRSVI